jgi:hypothetical protein
MVLCLGVFMGAQVPLVKETPMQAKIEAKAAGSFDVKMTPEDDKNDDGLSRMLLDKQYHGDLEGTGKGQMLTNGIGANGSGVYIAMEKFTGSLRGRTGSFVLYHTGVMTRGSPQLSVTVAPDSGTGQLEGITGSLKINIVDKKHLYDFEYNLPDTK